MNTAIIVAAGVGNRFGGETPKQFLMLRGKALLAITLEKFEECVDIDEIVLVVAQDRIEQARSLTENCSKLKKVVAGGASRAESVRNGLIEASKSGVVAIHDGARPMVSADEISRTVVAAKASGAACLTLPVTDTIKSVEGGLITGTLDRLNMRRAVTPQCFRYEIIERAFEEAQSLAGATDECFLVEQLGLSITAVKGSSKNLKVTMPEDLKIMDAFLDKE